MTDGHVPPDSKLHAGIGMQDRTILDIAALADLDIVTVTAQHRVEPDAAVSGQGDATDDGRVVG